MSGSEFVFVEIFNKLVDFHDSGGERQKFRALKAKDLFRSLLFTAGENKLHCQGLLFLHFSRAKQATFIHLIPKEWTKLFVIPYYFSLCRVPPNLLLILCWPCLSIVYWSTMSSGKNVLYHRVVLTPSQKSVTCDCFSQLDTPVVFRLRTLIYSPLRIQYSSCHWFWTGVGPSLIIYFLFSPDEIIAYISYSSPEIQI